MSKKPVKQESKFIKCVKAPIRALSKARDFYVNSLTDCSGQMNYSGAVGPVTPLPRSFSVNSSRSSDNEDYRELVRAASQRGLKEKVELEIRQQRLSKKKLPRSFTVGVASIDEDKASEFEEDYMVKKPEKLYPRSKSYAVPKSSSLVA